MRRKLQTLQTLTLAVSLSCAFQAPPSHNRRVLQQRSRLSEPTLLQGAADSSLLSDLDAFWKDSPYTAAALVCGFKASAADFVAQAQEFNVKNSTDEFHVQQEMHQATKTTTTITTTAITTSTTTKEDNHQNQRQASLFLQSTDWKRNAAFISYGALYQGISQEFIFNHLYPVWFGYSTDIQTVLTKVTFTLLVTTTVLTLPSLYAIKAAIEGYSAQQAVDKYIYDIRYQRLLQKFFLLWGPVLSLTFSVIPEHLRVTFVAVISFFWLIILSSISSGRNTGHDPDALATTDAVDKGAPNNILNVIQDSNRNNKAANL